MPPRASHSASCPSIPAPASAATAFRSTRSTSPGRRGEYDVATRFIELAGQINTAMPHYVVERLAEALDRRNSRGLNGARILLIGLAYKRNIDDMRESPSFKLIELIEKRGAQCRLPRSVHCADSADASASRVVGSMLESAQC